LLKQFLKLTVTLSTITQGKTATIKFTLKSAAGKAIANNVIYVTINKKTYTLHTDVNGVATLNVKGLKAGNYKAFAKFNGDNTYLPSNITTNQVVKAKKTYVDLAITKIKKIKSKNKQVAVYKITIKNKGNKASKKTTLTIQHIRKNGFKSKIKVVKVKALKAGKQKTYTVKFLPDRNHHKLCTTQVFKVNPKKSIKEKSYKNNKKIIKS